MGTSSGIRPDSFVFRRVPTGGKLQSIVYHKHYHYAKILEANASLVLGMSVRQYSVFCLLLSHFSSVLSSQFYSPSVHDDDEG